MALEMQLALNQMPLALSADFFLLPSGRSASPELHSVLAEAINFARASGQPAQIIITESETHDGTELKQYCETLIGKLQVEGEELCIAFEEIMPHTYLATVTHKKAVPSKTKE